jgi:LacI family transcriptional regulator
VVRGRAQAWGETLAGAGLPVAGATSTGPGPRRRSRGGGKALDARKPRPDALFCGNDQIARGAMDALRERGVAVPADVAVVGFDNWEVVARETPRR